MHSTFYLPTKIIFGSHSLAKLSQQKLPGKRALIVISSGTSTRSFGYLKQVQDQLDAANVSYEVFDKILPNPILTHVTEGAKLVRQKGCDFVIGLGGGSVIDSAKAIAIMATNEGSLWDYVSGGSGKGKPMQHKPLGVVAITTTAGTGTEADPWLVITKEETKEKIGYGNDDTFPVLSIVDPTLMVSVPPHLTAYQGFDALFHSTEGYLNKIANTFSDQYSLESIRLIGRSLPEAVKHGKNLKAREDVAMANTLAGMVETFSGCISEHSLEHAMSAFHPELPHGAGLIMISKAYYTHIAENHIADERMIAMAKALGKVDAIQAIDFVHALVDLQKACGVDDLKMSDYGITESELPAMVQNARANMGGLFGVDPMTLSDEECLKIYRESFR
ncbi:MAG: iron-containing alcohol dehydrogenase [Spirochaetales bacterium]|nr:iron-containing alcohol dehydrogenase [Spirochaetales bacterium]